MCSMRSTKARRNGRGSIGDSRADQLSPSWLARSPHRPGLLVERRPSKALWAPQLGPIDPAVVLGRVELRRLDQRRRSRYDSLASSAARCRAVAMQLSTFAHIAASPVLIASATAARRGPSQLETIADPTSFSEALARARRVRTRSTHCSIEPRAPCA
jgi:hypothetical protein